MEMLERRIDRVKKLMKGDKKLAAELESLEGLKSHLEEGKTARSFGNLDPDFLKTTPLLSAKPVIYAANMSDAEIGNYTDNNDYKTVKQIADSENAVILPICAEIEAEIGEMDPEDKKLFLDELNMENTGLERIIKIGYETLGQISFLTAGEDECRAWTITNGTKAPQAAGKIHTDFERGFIRAEVVAFEDLKSSGSIAAAREKGLLRLEGKDYVVKDGDIIHFRFNV
jgi:GTP-binding protein YchF